MGGGYSDLNVYLNSIKEDYSVTGYKVTVTQNIFPGCSDFVVFTHTISFNNKSEGLNYNVILYDGNSDTSKGNYIFGYYYPRDQNQVIQEVHVYYSVVAPDSPLIVSFKRLDNTYNCLFRTLLSAGWDRAYNISEHTFNSSLSKELLHKEFKKLSRNLKIQFKVEKECKYVTGGKQELGDKKSFRFIFTPNANFAVLGIDYLFAIDFNKKEPITRGDPNPEMLYNCKIITSRIKCQKSVGKERCNLIKYPLISQKVNIKHQNEIDKYYLRQLDGKHYDGIMVYFVRGDNKKTPGQWCRHHLDNNNEALLLEFIDSSKKKVQLQRKDEKGYWWAEEHVEYNGDKELSDKLSQIKSGLRKDVVTVIIDEKRKYLGLKNYSKDDKNVYTKYTFEFPKANKPILIFERKAISIGTYNLSSIKAIKVEVFYLKNKYGEDKQPFLIVFIGDRSPRSVDAYHFGDSYQFEEWVKFEFDLKKPQGEGPTYDPEQELKKKLYEKVEKIEKYSSCILELILIRWYAYKILTDPEFVPTQPPPKPPDGRPPIKKPQKQPDGPPIPWIVGGSVGGGVFVISSAALYGVYWYNTTIKLLT